jgi:hypothetical protein
MDVGMGPGMENTGRGEWWIGKAASVITPPAWVYMIFKGLIFHFDFPLRLMVCRLSKTLFSSEVIFDKINLPWKAPEVGIVILLQETCLEHHIRDRIIFSNPISPGGQSIIESKRPICFCCCLQMLETKFEMTQLSKQRWFPSSHLILLLSFSFCAVSSKFLVWQCTITLVPIHIFYCPWF